MKNEIPAYNNQEEKKEFFSLKIIDTDEQLFNLMKTLPKSYQEKEGIWRGLPESSYKLYNSLQRENIITSEFKTVQDIIKHIEYLTNKLAKLNRGVVLKYFDENHKIPNVPIYAALSILQHHGCNTPMLDWTRNPNVALYFATIEDEPRWKKIFLKAKIALFGKKENISNYFSIYFIKKEHPYYNLTSKLGYEEIISSDDENSYIQERVNFVIQHGGDKYLQKEARDNAIFELVQHAINQNKSITRNIETSPIHRIEDSPEEKTSHFLNVNYNINAQNGLFILNVDPFNPLEESIFNRIGALAKTGDLSVDLAKLIHIENFICYDIHKKFTSKIIEALNSEMINITNDTMFPDFRKLKDVITFERINKNISGK